MPVHVQSDSNGKEFSSFIDQLTEKVIETTTASLYRKTEDQLKILLSQSDQIGAVKSNFDLLIQRYSLEKSYLDQAAEWYGCKTWWNKLKLVIYSIGASTLIGAWFTSLFCSFLCAIIVYNLVSYILQNHFRLCSIRASRLNEDISKMEKRLVEQVDKLNKIEGELRNTFILIVQDQQRTCEDNLALESIVDEITAQTKKQREIIESLQIMQAELSANNPFNEAQLKIIKAETEITADQENLEQKIDQTNFLNEKIAEIPDRLVDGINRFESILTNYQQHQEGIEAQLVQITTNLEHHQNVRFALSEKQEKVNELLFPATKVGDEEECIAQLHARRNKLQHCLNLAANIERKEGIPPLKIRSNNCPLPSFFI